jgi:ATP-dependent RNA helicase DDX23/PRP28
MIFVNQKKDIDNLAKYVSAITRLKCATLHGDKMQTKREQALSGFKTGFYDVLICTNLASRGLDVEGVKHVINYDAPNSITDYTHRIGRTGRAGKKGVATTLLTKNDQAIFYDLRNYLMESRQKVPEALNEHPAAYIKPTLDIPKPEAKEEDNDIPQ